MEYQLLLKQTTNWNIREELAVEGPITDLDCFFTYLEPVILMCRPDLYPLKAEHNFSEPHNAFEMHKKHDFRRFFKARESLQLMKSAMDDE